MITVAWISLAIAFLCALIIAADELRRPQQMAIMNIVWPVTALYLSVFALWAYFTLGIKKTKAAMQGMEDAQQHHPMHQGQPAQQSSNQHRAPTPAQVAVAASHCGAGCTLADILIEFLVAALGLTLFGLDLWASLVYGLVVAWLFGIAFQYWSIQPMRHLPPGQALLTAIKADTLSILAFQTGMYAWMVFHYFVLAPHPRPNAFDPRYWLSMQVAMILGFATAYPMNRYLIHRGLKEAM